MDSGPKRGKMYSKYDTTKMDEERKAAATPKQTALSGPLSFDKIHQSLKVTKIAKKRRDVQ